MNKILTIALVYLTSAACAQTVRVVSRYPNSKYVHEVYDVLKSDHKTKHGDYWAFYKGHLSRKQFKALDTLQKNSIIGYKEKGQYRQNQKHGWWEFYSTPEKSTDGKFSQMKVEDGNYTADKKTGIWNTYLENGKVIKHFDFSANSEREASVRFSYHYPAEAQKNKVEGMVRIKVAYTNCEPTYQILYDIGYGCADAVIAALKEKNTLEKKYGIKNSNCAKREEVLSFKFKLN